MSSRNPSITANSCFKSLIRTPVIAKPVKSESKVRRRAFPTVIPCPISNGSIRNDP